MSDIAKMEQTDHTLARWRESEVSTVPFVKQLGTVLGREMGAAPKGGVWTGGRRACASTGFPPSR